METVYRRAQMEELIFSMVRAATIVLFAVFTLIPLIWLFINSIKQPIEYLATPPVILPSRPTSQNYVDLFKDPNSEAPLALKNSLIVTVVATVFSVLIGSLAAYAFTHLKWRLAPLLAGLVLLLGFYPKITAVIPYFVIMNNIGLRDTLLAIIIAFVGLNLPRTVWLMMTFFNDIPKELEQSAMLDGCGPWSRFVKIIVPLAAPGLAVAAIMSALLCWIEFMIASSLAVVKATTLPIAVSVYLTDKGMHWGPMSALGVVTVVPVIIFCLFVQRYLVRGLTLGALKG